MPFANSFWIGIAMTASTLFALSPSLPSPEALLECIAGYGLSLCLAASVWSLWSTLLQITRYPTKFPGFVSLLSPLPISCAFSHYLGCNGFLVPFLLAFVWLLALARSMCFAVWYGRPFMPTSTYDNFQDQVDDLRKETSGLRTYYYAFVASLTAEVNHLAIQVHGKDDIIQRVQRSSNFHIAKLRRELAIAKKEAKLEKKLAHKHAQDSVRLRKQQLESAFDAHCQQLRNAFEAHRTQLEQDFQARHQHLRHDFNQRQAQLDYGKLHYRQELDHKLQRKWKKADAEVAKYKSALDALAAKRPQDMASDVFDNLAAQHFFGERSDLKVQVQALKRRLNECSSSDLQRHVSEKLAAQDEVKILQDRLSIASSLLAQIEMLSVVSGESSHALEWELEIARQERIDRDITNTELQAKLQDLNRKMNDSAKLRGEADKKTDSSKDQSYKYKAALDKAENRLAQTQEALRNVVRERDEFKACVDSLEEELKHRNSSCCQCECPCCPLGCSASAVASPVASPSPIVQAPAPHPPHAPIPSPSPVLSPAPVVSPQVSSPDMALFNENALLRGQVASFQQLVDSLQQQASVSQQRIADLQLENNNIRTEGASLAKQLAPADERYRQMESQVRSSEANLSSVLHQLSVANARNVQLVQHVEQLSRQATPAAQISPSQDEIDHARKRAEQAEHLRADMEEQRQQDAMNHGMVLNQRQLEIMGLQNQIAELKKALELSTDAVNALKKDCNKLQKAKHDADADAKEACQDLEIAQQLATERSPDLGPLFQRIEALVEDRNGLFAEVKTLRNGPKVSRTVLDEVNAALDKKQAELQKALDDLHAERLEAGRRDTELQKLGDHVHMLERAHDPLFDKLDARNKTIKELKKDLDELEEERDTLLKIVQDCKEGSDDDEEEVRSEGDC